jgi:hypothetical protein
MNTGSRAGEAGCRRWALQLQGGNLQLEPAAVLDARNASAALQLKLQKL